jgi:hypothetical protein
VGNKSASSIPNRNNWGGLRLWYSAWSHQHMWLVVVADWVILMQAGHRQLWKTVLISQVFSVGWGGGGGTGVWTQGPALTRQAHCQFSVANVFLTTAFGTVGHAHVHSYFQLTTLLFFLLYQPLHTNFVFLICYQFLSPNWILVPSQNYETNNKTEHQLSSEEDLFLVKNRNDSTHL